MSWDPYDPGAEPGIDPGVDPLPGDEPTDLADPAHPFDAPAAAVDAGPSPDADSGLPNFDPAQSDPNAVLGNPGEAMGVWQQHQGEGACAIGAQGMVLEYLTGQRISEEELTAEAAAEDGFDGTGTAPDDLGNLLERHGVPVQQVEDASLEQLEGVLAEGEAAIVGLDADEIWAPGHDAGDDTVGDLPGIPGQGANHAVWVTGIDHSDPEHPMVVLNDSGHPEGQGLQVPLEEFMGAWQDSGNLLVAAGSSQGVRA
ncbi:C39 family peptidase [Streptomyces sp. NBC_01381]|uniref:C39 family peptidase n=1 Tax=Streptomyces sp. NBC_01381 TaxID=2903845 RepID=UPI002255CE04|nr:C39 family peptidase [Streptomyces sp. NBC_01381]MCX4671956.1 C39 family peptidase [Streptomyces sp. NBC_01381]